MTDFKEQLEQGGVRSLLIKLEIYERIEDYENCAAIVKAIQEHNFKYRVQHPTRLSKDQIYELK